MAVVCSRSEGAYRVYVDGVETASADISEFEGQKLGSNALVLGADLLGQYGLGNACVDQFEVYAGVPESGSLKEKFNVERVKLLAGEITKRLSGDSKIYTQESKTALAELAQRTLAELELPEVQASAEAQTRLYDSLKEAYEKFLEAPQKNAKLTMLMLSDAHIKGPDDAKAAAMETVFKDLEKWNA